jgi:hypothetical protein
MKLIPATNSTGGKTMQTFKHILLTVILITLVSSAAAKPGGGKGGGKPADGDDGTIPVSVTFLDAQTDLIGSDDGTPYLDGTDGVQAFLGSQANTGNIMLWLSKSPRGLYMDFSDCYGTGTDCVSPLDPILNGVISNSAIKVNANDVLTEGVFAMRFGEAHAISAPMRVYYDFDDGRGPGFIEFNPAVKGGSPCKNKSNFVTVVRISETSWEVSSAPGNRACATQPGGRQLAGIFKMPFKFTVNVL